MITQAVKLLVKQSSGEKHKKTQQGASTKLESYLYCYMLVCATISYPPHILLKATMCIPCALMLSSKSFYHVLGLWCHIMWPVMWLQCHVPLYCQLKEKEIQKKRNIKSRKIDKRKRKMLVSKVFYNNEFLNSVLIVWNQVTSNGYMWLWPVMSHFVFFF